MVSDNRDYLEQEEEVNTADELLKSLAASGRSVAYVDIVCAIVNLEPRQAEAMCLTLWAYPREHVLFEANRGNLKGLQAREGYSHRAAARQMGITHAAVVGLLERAEKNVAAYLDNQASA